MSITSAEQIEYPAAPEANAQRPALSQPFTVGDWRVIPELNRLESKHADEHRQLEPRLANLLCFLAANADRVLTRNELVQELWPQVIVNENSLTRAVSELRKQLQSADSGISNYIETIPKRGYRLIPPVEMGLSPRGKRAKLARPGGLSLFRQHPIRWGAALSTACLCLIVASWISLPGNGIPEPDSEAIFLSDELGDTERDFVGGEVQLSTMVGDPVVEAIATPVVSLDQKQYAFIQYDTTGSTIFLGGLGTAIEPVPVYYSRRHLFNLAWSPVGNSLLFAMPPSMTTTAAYSPINESADLVMLNLNTLETSRLVEELHPADNNSANGLNLT